MTRGLAQAVEEGSSPPGGGNDGSGGDGNGDDGTSGSISAGTYRIANVNSGLFLEVEGNSTEDGANVIQWPDTGDANQRWTFQEV